MTISPGADARLPAEGDASLLILQVAPTDMSAWPISATHLSPACVCSPALPNCPQRRASVHGFLAGEDARNQQPRRVRARSEPRAITSAIGVCGISEPGARCAAALPRARAERA
jgi:hypothetical protein